jgi:drug/metabolite transporter (DMT)-like permease
MLNLILGAICISIATALVKFAHVPAATSAFYRMAFGGVALLGILAVSRKLRKLTPGLMRWSLLCGAFFAGDLALWHQSILYVGPGLATILANFQAVLLAALALVTSKEKPDWRLLVSPPLALAGLLLMVGPDWSGFDAQSKAGVWYGLFAAVFYALYLLTLKRLAARVGGGDPLTSTAAVSNGTAVVLALWLLGTGTSFDIPDSQSLVSLVSLGLVSQALGWVLITRGMAGMSAARAGLLLLSQPTLVYALDFLLFDKPVKAWELCGAGLALTAIYVGGAGRSRVRARA